MTSSRPLYAPSLTESPDPRLLFAPDTLEINRTVFERCRVKGRPAFAPYTDEQKACMVRETAYEENKAALIETALTLPALLFVMWLAITLDRKVRLLSVTMYVRRVWNGRLSKIIAWLFYIAVAFALLKICLSLPDRLKEGRGMIAVGCLLFVLTFRREFRAFVVRNVQIDRDKLLRFWQEVAPAFNRPKAGAANDKAREEPKASPREEPRPEPERQRWSTADAEADYANALREAQSWVDSASSKATAEGYIRVWKKKLSANNVHPKDRLRYEVAIGMMSEKIKSLV